MGEGDRDDSVLRTVAAEHRSLEVLIEETRAVLRRTGAAGGSRVARSACARLREAIESHFEREEFLYYPTIWALRPDRKDSLLELLESHPRFRARLDAIGAAVEAEGLADAERHLDELTQLFGLHERDEERLLVSLQQELDARG